MTVSQHGRQEHAFYNIAVQGSLLQPRYRRASYTKIRIGASWLSASAKRPTILPLLYGKMTLAEALDEEKMHFFRWYIPVNARTSCFGSTSIVKTSRLSYHLRLDLANSETCRFGEFREKKHGSFNVTIPVYIDKWRKHPGETGAASASATIQSRRINMSWQCRRETPCRSCSLYLDSRQVSRYPNTFLMRVSISKWSECIIPFNISTHFRNKRGSVSS
jgi:hypothetical protein